PLDLLPTPDSSHRLNQANGLVGLDHLKLPSLVALGLLYRYGANQAPSRDVKHAALEKLPLSASTVTTPLGSMNRRPLVALHRSTGTYTLVAGRKPTGSVNGTALVPPVAIAPLRWATPSMLRTAAFDVPNGAFVHPLASDKLVKPVAFSANDAPSRDVKHAALEKLPLSASTVTTPLGEMSKRPLVALHRS